MVEGTRLSLVEVHKKVYDLSLSFQSGEAYDTQKGLCLHVWLALGRVENGVQRVQIGMETMSARLSGAHSYIPSTPAFSV